MRLQGVWDGYCHARIWHRISANPEGKVENEDCYTLVVREIDLVRAGDVVEKAMR
jgi:hypothetical protein